MKTLIRNRQKLFGTDGIRGTPGVYPLTDDMLAVIAQAVAQKIISENGATRKKHRVVIGKDTRLSGDNIEGILADSIRAFGVDVLIIGTITTPGLSFFATDLKADVGIMISASHNKATDNGIKFFNGRGHKFSQTEEEAVEDIIFEDLVTKPHPRAKIKGKLIKVKDAQSRYGKFLASTVKGLDLTGYKVALDCAWGAAAPFAKKIFTDLGAKVEAIHDKPSGDKVNEGGAIHPELLKKLVLETKADIGVAVDGDGDRGILVDETGTIVDGDCTIAIVARYLKKKNCLRANTVVGTVMSNLGLKVSLAEEGIKILCTNVGDKYVLESLLKNNLTLGGEQSGHIIFLDHLSTPDGLLTALQMLRVMKEKDMSLSKLCKCMTKFPQILVNVKVKERKPFEEMPKVHTKLQDYNSRLKEDGRILLRYSGTELLARVMVEGRDRSEIETIANTLASEIRQEIGAE
ncbi:MAG TPA: phosphoglucosamine mutase [Candidatus Omnitrophota bacterium]|nr:phosphoglucosamine mutase [Candidatus Omnitrophota bacterium]HRZ15633.1 phosphoglucosamine mutase [Candidatus Omnitrophota bacterium]